MTNRNMVGKDAPPVGVAPAVIMENPKYADNVAKVLRLCSCYGISQLWWTGDRVRLADYEGAGKRLPREERMKGYKKVELIHYDRPFDHFDTKKCTVVGVELMPGTESLHYFDWRWRRDGAVPKGPVWVFGPEDGSLGHVSKSFCHRFVHIPVQHCLNLATAVSTVLYDWQHKEVTRYGKPEFTLDEERGPVTEERNCFA